MKFKTKYTEYNCWKAMKNRCLNQNDPAYSRYGGRGIKVCKRWLRSFFSFLKDMGRRPSENHSIERINNDGDYSKNNCRWATPSEQQNNRRGNVLFTQNGTTQTVKRWCAEKSLNYSTVMSRINKLGWSVSDALN